MALVEFALIDRWFKRPAHASVALGIGDDCALLEVPAGQQLAVSIDTLVEGVHFFADIDPVALGHKALAVGLSDLAAMAAQPAWATLSLTLPAANESWLEGFSCGLFALAEQHGVQLVGGDTCRGPLSITMQLHGLLPAGQALCRSGAQPGDGIWVTGWPGEAALALAARRGELSLAADWQQALDNRLDRPQPRVAQGLALRGVASAAIDLSDGLCADLVHILERSGVGARLYRQLLPVSAALLAHLGVERARDTVLAGGDDYELCITVPAMREPWLSVFEAEQGVQLTRIGEVLAEPGLQCVGGDGRPSPLPDGYRHF
jgi:thiamine-monophosphate kinase